MRAGVFQAPVLGWSCVLALCLTFGGMAGAQEAAPEPEALESAVAVLTLDQDRLFAESAFGKASLERERAAALALEQENARIEATLIAEEQDLTTRRATLAAEEFAALATAFDEKVERIRDEQDGKARDLSRKRDEDRQAFLRAVIPVLGDLLSEKKAAVILDKSTVILSLTVVDITDEAISRVDALLVEGIGTPEQP